MPKQSNDIQDKTTAGPPATQEKRARYKELEKLTTREKLLRIMDLIGEESVGDDLLLKAIITLEGIEPEENHYSW